MWASIRRKGMKMHMKDVTKLACAIGLAAAVISAMPGTAVAQPGSRYQTIGERESMGLNPFGRPHWGRRAYAFGGWGHHYRIRHHGRHR
jgi:hypothetical protein